LDGDGVITTGHEDGLAIQGIPFVVTLPDELLLPVGQCRLQIEDDTLTLTADNPQLPFPLIRAASFLTEIRVRAGLPPVPIDTEASLHCALHCNCLAINGGRSMALHDESPERTGYTKQGAAAGRGSNMYPAARDYQDALVGWYKTA
jgi:hypothetical protein